MKQPPKCATAAVLDKLAGICCFRLRQKTLKRYVSPSPTTHKSVIAQHRDDKLMQFVEAEKEKEKSKARRKSRFVSEFRNQLCRIPLAQRTKLEEGNKRSFVLGDTSCDSRLRRGKTGIQRRKRTVSEWARARDMSFKDIKE